MQNSIFSGRAKPPGVFQFCRRAGALLCVGYLSMTGSQAQSLASIEGVTVKSGIVYSVRGERLEVLTDNVKFPSDVEATTNGTFTVAKGKERTIAPGQVLRRDGWLLNPDGSVESVFDHVTMKSGKVIVMRDGQSAPLTEPKTFPNGLNIAPDGTCIYPDGRRLRLVDGQIFRLDGSTVPAKDTISLKNGQVVVQKDGTLITLAPVQVMGMSDGTRVQGNGTVTKRDGTSFQLSEGQTVLIEGAATSR